MTHTLYEQLCQCEQVTAHTRAAQSHRAWWTRHRLNCSGQSWLQPPLAVHCRVLCSAARFPRHLYPTRSHTQYLHGWTLPGEYFAARQKSLKWFNQPQYCFYRAAATQARYCGEHLSVCLSNACTVTKRKHLAKKVQLSLTGSPLDLPGFPMNLRRTAYVAPNPPKGAQRRKVAIFRTKEDLSCKRSMLLVFWHGQRLVLSIVWPTPSPTTYPKLNNPAARFLCDSWATCFNTFCLLRVREARRNDVN